MARNLTKAIHAAHRRQVRDAQKRQRELAQQAKEQAKLSVLEQARLEVDAYENQLDMLMSVHKEQAEAWDWASEAVSLPLPGPPRRSYHENRAKQDLLMMSSERQAALKDVIELAARKDDREFAEMQQAHVQAKEESARLVSLARRICALESNAFLEAFEEVDPLAELLDYGASAKLSIFNPRVAYCELSVSGTSAVPSEVKTLTSTGKVSVKPMPRARFHEVYQDYICSCMLRTAREVFALLPIQTILVTASAAHSDGVARPVLSAAFTRNDLSGLDFDALDPSTAVEQFPHRGDFKASRKSGAFQEIIPLVPADFIPTAVSSETPVGELMATVSSMRIELNVALAELGVKPGSGKL